MLFQSCQDNRLIPNNNTNTTNGSTKFKFDSGDANVL